MNSCTINIFYKYFLTILSLLLVICSTAQTIKKDSTQQVKKDTFFLAKKKGWIGKLGKSIAVDNPAPADSLTAVQKSTAPFLQYMGKPIRKVIISKVDYGQSINDTSKTIKNFFNEIAKKLHASTRAKTIQNNLFIKEGEKLNPYLLGDNEIYLRTIPYLQDARITVKNASNDSVDVVILYKDVFPISGSIISADDKNVYLEGHDENMFGSGSRFQDQILFDLNRTPRMGVGAEYVKRNINGSFIDGTIGYQNLYPSFNNGGRQENNAYLQFDLPLVHPNRMFTGSFQASVHYTENDYFPDTLYNSTFKYRYNYADGWLAYNISHKKNLLDINSRKVKEFLAVRAASTDFKSVPDKYLYQYNYQYANLNSFLASFTIFKQIFYHTSYIYGFGRNEDIPKGYNISLTGGLTNKQNFLRPYYGIDVETNYFNKKDNYFNVISKLGGYYYQGSFEDISFLTSIESFTRLKRLGNSHWLLRHFASGSLTQQLNTKLNKPLVLNSVYGFQDFPNPDTLGSTRATLNLQTVLYNSWKVFGFNFAPFGFGNACYMKNIGEGIFKGRFFTEFGGGIRSRNENLIFGTMELKISYYPITVHNMTHWGISFNTNLIYKYNTQLIKRPDFVMVN